MGGGAIKKNGVSICSRLPRAAYLAVKDHVLTKLRPHVTECEGVLELPGKIDFGDLDVLYCHDAQQPSSSSGGGAQAAAAGGVLVVQTIPEIVKQHFGVVDPTHMVRHGPVTSFALNIKSFLQSKCPEVPPPATDYFQIDFIRAPSQAQLAMCRFYFGYGDVGGILGRIFNFYGMKFGEAGLWCELFSNTVLQLKAEEDGTTTTEADAEIFGHVPRAKKVAAVTAAVGRPPVVKGAELLAKAEEKDSSKRKEGVVDPTATLGRIPLVCDPAAICSYAGLDYAKWCRGFATVDDVIRWLIDCHFFEPSIFDRLNYEHMQRANKRPFYQQFLGHIHMTPGKAGATQVRCNKQLEAIRHFRQEHRLKEILHRIQLNKERRSKFNGTMLAGVIFDIQVDQAAAADDDDTATAAVKVLDGKTLGRAIFDFKAVLIAKKKKEEDADQEVVEDEAAAATAPAAASPSPSPKMADDDLFNKVLDSLTRDEVQAEMLLFGASYSPPAATTNLPVAAAVSSQKRRK